MESSLDIDKILSFAVPNNIDKIIERVAAGDEEKENLLWRIYMKNSYGIDDTDSLIKPLIEQCTYGDICYNLEEILESYFELNQYPSVDLLKHNVYQLLENGEMPNIEDTEDDTIIIDLTNDELSLPDQPLNTDETIDYFNKNLYQPRQYLFPHGLKVVEFNLANLNSMIPHQQLFDQELFDIELSRKYDLANDSSEECTNESSEESSNELSEKESKNPSDVASEDTEIDSDVGQSFFED